MKQWGWVSGIFSTQTCQQCALDVQRDNRVMCCGCVGSLARYFKSAGVIAIQEGVVPVLYPASSSNSIDDLK